MTDYDGEDLVDDAQDYIQGRLESGSEELEDLNQRADALERELAGLEGQSDLSADQRQRLEALRAERDRLGGQGQA